jgi:hypothetical protein
VSEELPRPTPDDDEAILAAARGALDDGSLTRWTTGELHRFAAIVESLDARVLRIETYYVFVRSARLMQRDEDSATVELDAAIKATGRIVPGRHVVPGNPITFDVAADGPARLVRENGDWKVVDLTLDGRSLRDSYFELDRAAGDRGLRVSALAGRVLEKDVEVYLELENASGAPVALRRVAIALPRRRLGWRWRLVRLASYTVEPGTTRIEAVGHFRDPAAAAGVRLLLETDSELIDVAPPSAEPRRRMPWRAGRPLLDWAVKVITIAVVAGIGFDLFFTLLGGEFLWVGWISGAGIMLAGGSGALLSDVARGKQILPGSRVHVYGVVTTLFVVGVAAFVATWFS